MTGTSNVRLTDAPVDRPAGRGKGLSIRIHVATMLGMPLAMFIAFSSSLNKMIYPAAAALEMMPKIAFAPLVEPTSEWSKRTRAGVLRGQVER